MAITRPAPILTIAASLPSPGPTTTSGRAAPRWGTISRSSSPGESLPVAGGAGACVRSGMGGECHPERQRIQAERAVRSGFERGDYRLVRARAALGRAIGEVGRSWAAAARAEQDATSRPEGLLLAANPMASVSPEHNEHPESRGAGRW